MNRDMKLDPITFEVIRHRLWSINHEMALTLGRVSGSPIATESGDFNTGLLDAEGNVLVAGVYVASHAATLDQIAKYILENYHDNPGINEGDMFICSDPYIGALHQNDVVCMGPIHWNGEIVAWAGSAIHQVDVGGPVPGGFSIGATSIFEEPMPIPPLKIVERGVIRRDIEMEYLNRSRMRELVGLDLRAQVAAVNICRQRMGKLIEQYGNDAVKSAMSGMVDYVEKKLRQRLRHIPDGVWSETLYLDHDGLENRIYSVKLDLEKKGETLLFDFRDAAPQAPALINCTANVLRGGVISSSLPLLAYDMPWTPAGFWRIIELKSTPGTVVDALWPAGVSAATVEANRLVCILVNICIGKMLAASEVYRDKAAAGWAGSNQNQNLYGIDKRGNPFGTMILDSVAGGAAARAGKDGIDSGGSITSLATSIANVERNEYLFPMLYLYRRHSADTGGAGKWRGGVGVEHAFFPYETSSDLTCNLISHGVEVPPSVGIGGGYPGSTCNTVIIRNSNIRQLMENKQWPEKLEQLAGEWEVMPAKAKTHIGTEDVYFCAFPGGSGFSDPILRDPNAVLHDVKEKLVTAVTAERIYGVPVATDFVLNPKSIKRTRETIRRDRAKHANGARPRFSASSPKAALQTSDGVPYTPSMDIQGDRIACVHCRSILSEIDADWKLSVPHADYPLQHAGPKIQPIKMGDRFLHREYYCPDCWTILDIQIIFKEK